MQNIIGYLALHAKYLIGTVNCFQSQWVYTMISFTTIKAQWHTNTQTALYMSHWFVLTWSMPAMYGIHSFSKTFGRCPEICLQSLLEALGLGLYPDMLNHLNLPELETRRKMLYKFVNNLVFFPEAPPVHCDIHYIEFYICCCAEYVWWTQVSM